jgi:hypothetical protein
MAPAWKEAMALGAGSLPCVEKLAFAVLLGIITLLLSACHVKLVFAMDSGRCLNRFTYGSKLAPSHPEVVPCDSPDAWVRNDGFCLKYLVRVGYCYPAVNGSATPPGVLLYAPSACDEPLPLPDVPFKLLSDRGTQPASSEFTRFVVTDIKSPDPGQHCDSTSLTLQPPEEIEGPGIPPATSQLVCLAPK